MKTVKIVPYDWPCTLAECPPGLFIFNNCVGFKNEYGSGEDIEVFCVESGEYFWGGASTKKDRAALIVQPAILEEADHE